MKIKSREIEYMGRIYDAHESPYCSSLKGKGWWIWGRLSGYPVCCRLWFQIRWAMMSRFPKLFKNKPDLSVAHVLCPCHRVLYRAGSTTYTTSGARSAAGSNSVTVRAG